MARARLRRLIERTAACIVAEINAADRIWSRLGGNDG
jgi:hypothetical protein